jgi:hypothetical protein
MKSKTMDENQSAARVVGKTIAKHSEKLPADLDAAWAAWSAGVGHVDARTMLLLKAAFEAGAEVGKRAAR